MNEQIGSYEETGEARAPQFGSTYIEPVLLCPRCSNPECHIEHVHVNAGGKITEISRTGVSRAIGKASGRGALVRIGFFCEQCEGDAPFTVEFQFHKGNVFVNCKADRKARSARAFTADLWRD